MIDALHEIDKILEAKWRSTVDVRILRRAAEMGTWFIGGFYTGLRGEEMVRIEFAGTAKSVDKYMAREIDPYFILLVTG
jgi:hypothetical protein